MIDHGQNEIVEHLVFESENLFTYRMKSKCDPYKQFINNWIGHFVHLCFVNEKNYLTLVLNNDILKNLKILIW